MGKNPNGRPVYRTDRTYQIPLLGRPQPFIVQSQSNDDIDKIFLDKVKDRLIKTKGKKPDLVAALCPAKELRNSMLGIIRNRVWDQLNHFHFYLLEYKWDGQAKLLLDTVESHIAEINRPSSCYRILGLDLDNRTTKVRRHFQHIYG